MHCYYCDRITAVDPGYQTSAAEFDLGSEAPRCARHWRFACDHCGEPGHFVFRFYCPRSSRFLCLKVGPTERVMGEFWAWQYWWEPRSGADVYAGAVTRIASEARG